MIFKGHCILTKSVNFPCISLHNIFAFLGRNRLSKMIFSELRCILAESLNFTCIILQNILIFYS